MPMGTEPPLALLTTRGLSIVFRATTILTPRATNAAVTQAVDRGSWAFCEQNIEH
jgi:hypothetical protein